MYCTMNKEYDKFTYEFLNNNSERVDFEYNPAIEDIRDFILEQLAKEMPDKTEEQIEEMLEDSNFMEEQMKEYYGDMEEFFEAAAEQEFKKEKYWEEKEDEDY